jgi:hypothetical protein
MGQFTTNQFSVRALNFLSEVQMSIGLIFLFLIGVIDAMPAKARPTKPSQITLCKLLSSPGDFNHQKVTLDGKINPGEEAVIFIDEGCAPRPPSSDLVLVVFSKTLNTKKPAYKQLMKRLNSHRLVKGEFGGVFTTFEEPVGHQMCCKFQFEITEINRIER